LGEAERVAVPLPGFFVERAGCVVGDQSRCVEVVGIDVIEFAGGGAAAGLDDGDGLVVEVDGFVQRYACAGVFA
jgi:hypothetical protein